MRNHAARPMTRRRQVLAALQDARATYRRISSADEAPTQDVSPAPEVVAPPRAAPETASAPVPVDARVDHDVVLDVPTVHVDEIDLSLEELKARVALEAHVLDLLRLDV